MMRLHLSFASPEGEGFGPRKWTVRIGNVETATGRRRVFGAVAKTGTDLGALIRGSLDAVGRTEGTVLTAFTDGCSGLRRILLDAGIAELPILDWFHLAMRLQHLTRVAGALPSDGPERAAAKAVIVREVERLRWRLWNGKARDAGISLDRIRAVVHHSRGEPDGRDAPSHLRVSCGPPCGRSTVTSSARAISWATTANGSGAGGGGARRGRTGRA